MMRISDGRAPEGFAAVRLGDGHSYALSLPSIAIRPVARETGGDFGIACVPSHGAEIDELIRLSGMLPAGSEAIQLSIAASVAAALLRRSADYSEPELDRLLCLRPADPSSLAWPSEVMAIAAGKRGTR